MFPPSVLRGPFFPPSPPEVKTDYFRTARPSEINRGSNPVGLTPQPQPRNPFPNAASRRAWERIARLPTPSWCRYSQPRAAAAAAARARAPEFCDAYVIHMMMSIGPLFLRLSAWGMRGAQQAAQPAHADTGSVLCACRRPRQV